MTGAVFSHTPVCICCGNEQYTADCQASTWREPDEVYRSNCTTKTDNLTILCSTQHFHNMLVMVFSYKSMQTWNFQTWFTNSRGKNVTTFTPTLLNTVGNLKHMLLLEFLYCLFLLFYVIADWHSSGAGQGKYYAQFMFCCLIFSCTQLCLSGLLCMTSKSFI